MKSAATDSLSSRYERAFSVSPPRVACQSWAATDRGYWLDCEHYCLLPDPRHSECDQDLRLPRIIDCESGSMTPAVAPEQLANLLQSELRRCGLERASTRAELSMPDRHSLAVVVSTRTFVIDVQRVELLRSGQIPVAPASYSPDGRWAYFCKDSDLWRFECATGEAAPLTLDGQPHCCYAQQSETALAAVSYRRHPQPVGIWSPDSRWFFTHLIDERDLPEMPLVQHVPPGGARPQLHTYKYSMPGDPLPLARFVAIETATGRVVRVRDADMLVGAFSPITLRRAWFSGEGHAWLVRLDRHSRSAELLKVDLSSGTSRVVLTETTGQGYIDLHPSIAGTPNVRTLSHSDEVIWYSQRDGWGHLYLHDARSGVLKNQITKGDWLVRDLVHVDEASRRVIFLAGGLDGKVDSARRCLCRVNFDGSGLEVLLKHDGDIWVAPTEPAGQEQDRPFRPPHAPSGVSSDGRHAFVHFGSASRGNRTEVVDLEGRGTRIVVSSVQPGPEEVAPLHFSALAADQQTHLSGTLFFPRDFDERRAYPLVDYIYPGPQIAHQPQSWGSLNAAPARALAELGCIVMMLDTRGLPIGSRQFHHVGYPHLLEPQISDHAAVIRHLVSRHGFIDPQHIGVIGHSGGGAAAVRVMCAYPELFTVGIAVCGNHYPDLYTSAWSDKYRGEQAGAATGADSSGPAVDRLSGKLLLVSGDMDENVHVSQTFRLAHQLVRANRDFDLLIVPNEGHLLMMTSAYAQRRIWDYLVRHLLEREPPAQFEMSFAPEELAKIGAVLWQELRQ